MWVLAFLGISTLLFLGGGLIYCGYIQVAARTRHPSSGCRFRGAKWPGRVSWVLLVLVVAGMMASGVVPSYYAIPLLLAGAIWWTSGNIERMFVRIDDGVLVAGSFLGGKHSVRMSDIAGVDVVTPGVLVIRVKQASDVAIPALLHNMPGLLAAITKHT